MNKLLQLNQSIFITQENVKKYVGIDTIDNESLSYLFESSMRGLGFHAAFDMNGNVINLFCITDETEKLKKSLTLVAPYVTSGSYLVFKGDTGLIWRYFFHNQKCYLQFPEYVWPEIKENTSLAQPQEKPGRKNVLYFDLSDQDTEQIYKKNFHFLDIQRKSAYGNPFFIGNIDENGKPYRFVGFALSGMHKKENVIEFVRNTCSFQNEKILIVLNSDSNIYFVYILSSMIQEEKIDMWFRECVEEVIKNI